MDAALPFVEKYRPKKLDEVLGQEHVVEFLRHQLELYRVGNYGLPHIMFVGGPGIGKTAVAGAFFNELFGPGKAEAVMETNASLDRGIDYVREDINRFATTKPVGGFPFNIIFLDEFDAMTKPAQEAMRRIIEINSRTCRFWATVNDPMAIIEPIRNRFLSFRFRPIPSTVGVGALERVANLEKIKYDPGTLEALYEKAEGSLRASLNFLQSIVPPITMEKVGKIEDSMDKQLNEILGFIAKGEIKEGHKKMIALVRGGATSKELFKALLKATVDLKYDGAQKFNGGALHMAWRLASYEDHVVGGANMEIQLRGFLFELEEFLGHVG
jgi:replication factor C small subunit